MNFRITTLFFALLLTMLWVFGLMVAHKKASGETTLILPIPKDAEVNSVVVKRSEDGKETVAEFVKSKDDRWFLKEGSQQARVEGVRIDQNIIQQIRDAKPDDTAADVSLPPKHYGLNPPRITVILSGTVKKEEEKSWELYIGKESPDQTLVYVSSSKHMSSKDGSGKIFAINKRALEGVLFKNPNHLRSKRLFDSGAEGVRKIFVKKDDMQPLEIERTETNLWNIVQPPLGIAGSDSIEPDEKKKDPLDILKKDKFKDPEPPTVSGVKALLSNIMAIRLLDEDDMEPLGKPAADFGLDLPKARMRIEITSGEKKDLVKEVLLIGNKTTIRKEDYYYAKLDNPAFKDDGVVMIAATILAPILKTLEKPGELRSLDIAAFDAKKVDAIVLSQGNDVTKFFLQAKDDKKDNPFEPMDQPSWNMYRGQKKEKASEAALRTLLDQMMGKKSIVKFLDEEPAKKEAEWGLVSPTAEISLYIGGIEPVKKEEKKDDKDKKDEKKDDKDKKDELKVPSLKKDHKPTLTLAIGKIDGDHVYIRRTLEDGKTKSWFTVKKDIVEKVFPKEGVALAYRDTALPEATPDQAWAIKLKRPTDKGGSDVLDLERRMIEGKPYWYILDKLEPTGAKLADNQTTNQIVAILGSLNARKWHKELGDKEDLTKYGLNNPGVVASLTVKKNPATKEAAQAAFCAAVLPSFPSVLAAILADFYLDKGEIVTIEFGKDETQDKEKFTYAKHSGSKLLFSVDAALVKFVKEKDLRDRTFMMHAHAMRVASYLTTAGSDPVSLLNFASPHISGKVHDFDAEKVTKVNLSVRTPYELRTFQFERLAKEKPKEPEKAKETGKDKEQPKDKGKEVTKEKDDEKTKESPWTWADKSGIPEFQLDPEKVAQFLKDIAKLETNRFVAFAGGPRGEHKLDLMEAMIKLDLDLEGGKKITLLVGTSYQNHGYFATSNVWQGADGKLSTVFFLSPTAAEPMLRGTLYFGKERIAAN